MSEATILKHEVPEGWYPDPVNPQLQRWWSGSQWTEHVRHWEGVVQPSFLPSGAFAAQQSQPDVPSFASYTQSSFAAQPDTTPSSYLDGRVAPTTPAPWDVVESDPAQAAYVPMTNRYSASAPAAQTWSRRAYSPSTMSIWVLALTPLLWLAALWVATEWVIGTSASVGEAAAISLGISGGLLAVAVLSALFDSRQLQRNMAAPSFGWIFLGVIPYFVVRWAVLKRQGLSYAAPGITFLLLFPASAALWVYVLGPSAVI